MSFTHQIGSLLMSALVAAVSPDRAGSNTAPLSVLSVAVGQSLLIRSPGVKRVSAGDGRTVDVKVFDDTQEILVLGRQPGTTDLRIWARDGSSAAYLVQVLGIVDPIAAAPALQAEATILIKARLIEVRKSALREFGIDWAETASGPTFATWDQLTLSSIVDSTIHLLVNRGDARLLAEPTLTCINGGKADFLVGGEVPIPVQNQDGALNVVFKQFGIILNVEPRAGADGLIRAKVGVEVSSVDKANAVLGIPGFATRKTNTEMNVATGEPMILSGLFSAEDAKTVAKVPGLSALPILGELFKSRQFSRGETELVLFITPQVIDAATVREGVQRHEEMKRESDQALQFDLRD